jgi:predicted NBD/HSP70 family sugar kinase
MANYQQAVKMTNKSLILETIRTREPVSRAGLAQLLHLTKATVSSLVEELIAEKYCYQTGPGKSSGGRRPLMLQFNEKAGFAVSCDIGVNYIFTTLTDLRGTVIHELYRSFDTNDFTRTVMEIKVMIDDCLKHMPDSPFGLVGIGFGVPGLVTRNGTIVSTPNLDWHQSNLKDIFTDQYETPIIVENEANAGAYGEKIHGAAGTDESFIYISAGIGIGAGIVLDGRLIRGASGFSGEIGHTTIVEDGLKCRCGNSGCWEMYASEMALLSSSGSTLLPGDLEKLIEKAASDKTAEQAFERIGHYLGVGVTNIIHTFNPERIIIGNRLVKARAFLEPKVQEAVNERTLPALRENTEIIFNERYQYASIRGLAAFSIEHFLEKQFSSHASISV